MKFLCIACDEAMRLTSTAGPDEGSLTVTFACPACGHRVALLTNPWETQLVRTLGVKVGGRTAEAAPFGEVRAGLVRVGSGGERAEKPGQLVAEDAELLLEERPRYVSRGGVKLENAIRALDLPVQRRDCLDVGASTGGFTDCLLQRGARRVYAVDVGRGQLHPRLRADARVTVLEGVNARRLDPAQVKVLPLAQPELRWDLALIWKQSRHLPPAARAFVDVVRRHAGDGAPRA